MYGYIMYGGQTLSEPGTANYYDAGALSVAGTNTISVSAAGSTFYTAVALAGLSDIQVDTTVSRTLTTMVLPDINLGLV